MIFAAYQTISATTCLPRCYCFEYLAPGLINEAGEVCGKIKRLVRGDLKLVEPEHRELIIGELGDVLWYAAIYAKLKRVNIDGLILGGHPYYPCQPSIPHLEQVAADISAGAHMFRSAPSYAQLRPLLKDIEKMANAIGYTMHEVAERNIKKLRARKKEDKIKGTGDVR